MLNPYTKEDDERLLRYIATYNPERTGRSGNKLYQDLVAQHKRWPWSKRHPWSSWRERYVKHNKEFDKKISDWQKAHADRPGTLTNLKKFSQREKPSITSRPPAAKTAKGTSSTGAPRPVKATINDNGKRGRSSIGQSTSQSLKRPRLQTTVSKQNVESAIRPAVVKKKPSPTTTASKGKEKARPMSDSETEPESEGPAGPDDYNYKGQVFEKEEEEEEENPPQEMETDGVAAETPARSQSIWNDIPRDSQSPEPVADSRRVSPTIAAPLAAVSEIPVIAATPPRALVSTAQTNRPITPKPDGDQELHISQEPTPPRSGVSETPQGSPASSPNGRLEMNTPYSQHSVERLRITELTSVGLEHLHTISVHGSSSPVTERPTIPAPRRRTFFKVRQMEPEDIFETASSNGSPAAAPPRKQREPPRLIEGPYVSSFADSSGASRLTSGGRRTNGAVDQSDESESEADERPPDPNWPPRRGSLKGATHAKPAITETSPKTIIAADSTAVSRVSSRSKDGASVQRVPAVPAMKHVLEKLPARAIFPRPPQVNAEASSSKVKLPGPIKPATRASPTSTAYGTDEPVKFPRTAASKPSAAPVPRASSLARTKDPFSKDFIRTETESDGSARAIVKKGKTKAKLMIDRRQTFSGVPPHDAVPHLDLANEVRKREHQRSNGRQSVPLIDLRARRASSAASRSSTSASAEVHRPRRNSTPSAFSLDQGPRRASSIASSRASVAPTSVADMRRLSAAPHDMQLAVQESLEGVLLRLAQNHGFSEAVARRIWERVGDFRRTDETLRMMRERAQEALDQFLGDELEDEGDEAEEDEEDQEEDDQEREEEQDAEAEEEADVAMLVNPSRSASDCSASPAPRAPALHVSIPRASVSPVRASNGFEYTPLPEPEPRPAHYSPASPTRARQYNRLVRAGRAEEARLREIRRASRGYVIGTIEAGAQGGGHAEEVEEDALEDEDVEMYEDEAEGDGWDAENAARAFEEQEREEREREEREERERAAAEQERLRREMEKAAERRAEKARRAQERRAAAEERRLREEAEQRERAESEQRQRLERGRLERAQMERERLERARVERERMERERVERARREREQKERMERERLEQEHRERVEQERGEMEQRERAQRAQQEREEAQRREREEEQEVAESTTNVEPSYEMDLNPEADIPEEQIQSPTNEQCFGDEDSDGLIGEKEDYLPGPLRPSSPLVQESQRSGGSQQGHDGTPEPQWTEEDYFTLFNGDATELRDLAERVGPRSIKWQIADAYAEVVGN